MEPTPEHESYFVELAATIYRDSVAWAKHIFPWFVIAAPVGVALWLYSSHHVRRAKIESVISQTRASFLSEIQRAEDLSLCSIRVENKSNYRIKNLRLDLRSYSESGSTLDKVDTTIFGVVESSSYRTFENIEISRLHSQRKTVYIKVTDLELDEEKN